MAQFLVFEIFTCGALLLFSCPKPKCFRNTFFSISFENLFNWVEADESSWKCGHLIDHHLCILKFRFKSVLHWYKSPFPEQSQQTLLFCHVWYNYLNNYFRKFIWLFLRFLLHLISFQSVWGLVFWELTCRKTITITIKRLWVLWHQKNGLLLNQIEIDNICVRFERYLQSSLYCSRLCLVW